MANQAGEKWACPNCDYTYTAPIEGTSGVWHTCPKKSNKAVYLEKVDTK